ncbi:iron-sulfur cluster biosynthesis family protein [Agromyces bauzanensis]|uniref:Iron-sulfur cluster biosynthesis protein n=1 Tax=Agromyces bauzanensis TaxID=1308924 RepID=A0A917PL75_9MICO|nr:iron-sulfur cluster biosynthesis family protein [Agromyces bauzanensis]GGJ83627.1 iron-sulfur cluster biosynthesis protein [Agromyces bauzanensis]
MLTLTDNASTAVRDIVERSGGTGGAGLRIDADDAESTDFAVAIVPTPLEHDTVVEQDGARVYLGENAAWALDDKLLDARVSEDGRVAFDLLRQEP